MSNVNAVSVSHLPPETLALVFRFLSYALPIIPTTVDDVTYVAEPDEDRFQEEDSQEEDSEDSEDSAGSVALSHKPAVMGPLSTWIKVTSVCRYWRDVALSDKSLWADISTAHSWTWTDAFLARSSASDMRVHLDNHVPNTPYNSHVWNQIMLRMRTLHITGSFEYWQERLRVRGFTPILLTKLSINLSKPYDEGDVSCPSRIFSDDIQSLDGLRELMLCGYFSYDWPSPLFRPTLTSLKLGVNADSEAMLQAPLQAIRDALSQLPELQRLTLLGLARISPQVGDQLESHPNTIHLPRLQLLHIEDCHSAILLTIFDAILISANAKIHLIPLRGRWGLSTAATFFEILDRRLSSPSWNSFQTVAVMPTKYAPAYLQLAEPDEYKTITVSAWRADIDAHDLFFEASDTQTQELEPDFYFRLPWEYGAEHQKHPHEALRLFGRIPIRTLCLLSDRFFAGKVLRWDELSREFSALRHILVLGDIFMDVIQCLYTSVRQTPLQHPELRKLTFLGGDEYCTDWAKKTRIRKQNRAASYTYAQLLERVHQICADSGLAVEIFVDDDDFESDVFDSISDKSILQTLPSEKLA